MVAIAQNTWDSSASKATREKRKLAYYQLEEGITGGLENMHSVVNLARVSF
jgi:hypothetical protein